VEGNNVRIMLTDTTDTLLREIADPAMKRADVALTYAMALRSDWKTDWGAVNRAIIARWSRSALVFIKTQAGKIAEAGPAGPRTREGD
jgi:hypothetical protein